MLQLQLLEHEARNVSGEITDSNKGKISCPLFYNGLIIGHTVFVWAHLVLAFSFVLVITHCRLITCKTLD